MSEQTATTRQCPRDDGTMLVAVERNGVTIDACPRCRGIWLDRGELDKLIELEAKASEDFLAEIQGSSQRSESQSSGHGSGHGSGYGKKKRKRGSFLGDMLDFG